MVSDSDIIAGWQVSNSAAVGRPAGHLVSASKVVGIKPPAGHMVSTGATVGTEQPAGPVVYDAAQGMGRSTVPLSSQT